MKKKIKEATQFLQEKGKIQPKIGIILGSGLGGLVEEVTSCKVIPYEQIPHFPVSTVEGHGGNMIIGYLHDIPVIMMQGRFHYYEGYSMQEITFPVRVMKALGIESLLVTNAAGGINESFVPGDLMIINDHIQAMGSNPLIGGNDEQLGARFPDMSRVYKESYRTMAKEVAKRLGISIKEGVYIAVTGPSYETPAEIRMFRTLGADAVGMSTVPEVIVAGHTKLPVLGISCITNLAAGVSTHTLSHKEVIETTERVKETFQTLAKEVVVEMVRKGE
ncbi:purine-nucleoside phosphorylase [Massilibacterium senegalense]|uniref:purine-nucleoside phosphorylase n=1 Tax=Massilibacterium senegalense TaxID=1632858 RepID=UPI000785C3CB|nr:purine-nucleoside phosphorylase [Massilibacterium senegalense]